MAPLRDKVVIDLSEHFEKPVPHQYLHGYLRDEPETRFSLLLPDLGLWSGRLIQFLEGGMGGNEYINPQSPGNYVVQKYGSVYLMSNHGHVGEDLSKIGYKGLEKVAHLSNYKTLLCAREIMKEKYGKYPNYVYILGGSGGGLRGTILLEKYPEMYDGAVVIVQGETSIITYYFSLFSKYGPVLKPKLSELVNAVDVGGIGDPFKILETEEQKDALQKLYNAGFPRGAEPQINTSRFYMMMIWLIMFFEELLELSPERVYYQDFWCKKGYAGYDGEVAEQIVEGIEGKVLRVYTLEEIISISPKEDVAASQPLMIGPEIEKDVTPSLSPELMKKTVGFKGTRNFASGELIGYTVTFKTGKLSGKSFHISNNTNDVILISGCAFGYPEGIEIGDEYVIDNRDLLAFSHYHRHIITLVEDTYRPPDFLSAGKPVYPQRPIQVKKILKMKHFQTGDFKGKMISIFAAQDIAVWPPVIFNYLSSVKKQKGPRLDDYYRIYFVENASHAPPINLEESFSLVSFYPMVGRALDYLIEWVEKGVDPPPSTVAKLSSDYTLSMPKTAAERKGIQPVITRITANGQSDSVKVRLGNPVKFDGIAEAPIGNIIKYEWYCQNLDDFYCQIRIEDPKPRVNTPYTYTFRQSGIYFAVLRITSDLGGNIETLAGGQRNLARIRIIVER